MKSEVELKYPLSHIIIRNYISESVAYKMYGIDTTVQLMNNTPRYVLDAFEYYLEGEYL